MKRGKNYLEGAKLIDRTKLYAPIEALDLVCKASKAKFDETVECHIKLGVDSRHADQQVRGAVILPNGTGKKVRVLVVTKIQSENWFDFDVVVATPNMMGVVGRLGKVLGPRGLMPTPKAGTVTMDVAKAIEEIKSGKIEYKLDKTNIIHCPIGKVSFGAEKLNENFMALANAVIKAKPAAAKGTYIKSLAVASTMGPSAKVNSTKLGD